MHASPTWLSVAFTLSSGTVQLSLDTYLDETSPALGFLSFFILEVRVDTSSLEICLSSSPWHIQNLYTCTIIQVPLDSALMCAMFPPSPPQIHPRELFDCPLPLEMDNGKILRDLILILSMMLSNPNQEPCSSFAMFVLNSTRHNAWSTVNNANKAYQLPESVKFGYM